MRVYEATVIDKCAYPAWTNEVATYESYIVVDDKNDGTKATDWELFYKDLERETGFTEDDIHYYFTKDEFKPKDGEIETEEFKYLIGERVA